MGEKTGEKTISWALEHAAVIEMTRTARDNDSDKKDKNQLDRLFILYFIAGKEKSKAGQTSLERERIK